MSLNDQLQELSEVLPGLKACWDGSITVLYYGRWLEEIPPRPSEKEVVNNPTPLYTDTPIFS